MATPIVTICLFITGIILTIFGYFIKNAYTEIRKDIELLLSTIHSQSEEIGKLKGKTELIEQEARLKYQAIQEQTQIEIKNLAKHVGDLSDVVKKCLLNKAL